LEALREYLPELSLDSGILSFSRTSADRLMAPLPKNPA
jgi:hypothetical protein